MTKQNIYLFIKYYLIISFIKLIIFISFTHIDPVFSEAKFESLKIDKEALVYKILFLKYTPILVLLIALLFKRSDFKVFFISFFSIVFYFLLDIRDLLFYVKDFKLKAYISLVLVIIFYFFLKSIKEKF